MQTHLEPLSPTPRCDARRRASSAAAVDADRPRGDRPPAARAAVSQTDVGLVAFLTLGLDGQRACRRARARERDRGAHTPGAPEIADVIVHTEP